MDREPMSALAALDDPSRRGMYAHIRRARHPVTRDEAAEAVGISRKLAAFHLDKLVAAGLLRTRYEFAGGVRKVGRAPKVYEPSDIEVRVSVPPRRPDVLAEILLDAVLGEGDDETARDAALRSARRHGRDLGAAERDLARPGRLGTERALTLASALVERHGFEPDRETPACLRLRNCPFHPLAARAPELVCGINQAFLGGVLEGLQAATVEAVLDPRAGECCVELRPA
ncbi:helix-turn-helix domain-containing protein [Amycolatopsis sp. NPDC051102]|uniref:helix-turn-helix transcriptional regulator n=1 Tax=Amycolatopsis sp. NPDC051102 TaxID=3155163 RepID=UPI003425CDA5